MPTPPLDKRLDRLEQDENPLAALTDAELLERLGRAAHGEPLPGPEPDDSVSPDASPALADMTDREVMRRLDAARALLAEARRRAAPPTPAAEPPVTVDPEPVEPHPVMLGEPSRGEQQELLTPRQQRERDRRERDAAVNAEMQEAIKAEELRGEAVARHAHGVRDAGNYDGPMFGESQRNHRSD